MVKRKVFFGGFFVFVGLFLLLRSIATVQAADVQSWIWRRFDGLLNQVAETKLAMDGFNGMTDLAMTDLGGDGINEMLVTLGYQESPAVVILRADGSEVNRWQPYGAGFTGRINVAAADLQGDGKQEIVTAPGEGGGPQVRIFDTFGKEKEKGTFFVEDTAYRSGVELALGNVNNDKALEIITSTLKDGKNLINVYDAAGQNLPQSYTFDAKGAFEPMKLAACDLDSDGQAELVAGAAAGSAPILYYLDFAATPMVTKSVMAYGVGFAGGMDVTCGQFDGKMTVITAAGFGGGPHVRFYNATGDLINNDKFFAFDKSVKGGLNIGLGKFVVDGKPELLVLPQILAADGQSGYFAKMIKVDISEQKLYAYDRGRLVKSFLISSGKKGHDTPLGTFKVYRKRALVDMSWYYGPDNPQNYDLKNVPHVLSFLGPYTIHGAYWHHNWGHRMSHGCVNVSLEMAKWIYDWTPMNTPVVIQE